MVSLIAQLVKNLPAMRETSVRSLGWEDPLEEGMATHPSILAWRIPMDRGAWQAPVHGVTKTGAGLSDFHRHTLTIPAGKEAVRSLTSSPGPLGPAPHSLGPFPLTSTISISVDKNPWFYTFLKRYTVERTKNDAQSQGLR